MKALYIEQHAQNCENIVLPIKEMNPPSIKADECLVKMISSGINMSDALGTLGYFPQAVLPRIPGRDFAGRVVQGPAPYLHKLVWGSGGGMGIDSNGSQAEYITMPIAAIAEIPTHLNPIIAGGQTLPFITAYYGLIERAQLQRGERVLILGAQGQVGRAAYAISNWQQGISLGLVKNDLEQQQAQSDNINAISGSVANLFESLMVATKQQGFDVIFNSLGTIYFETLIKVLSPGGRLVTIATPGANHQVAFNLHSFYKNNQTMIGVDTTKLDIVAGSRMLNTMRAGFEAGALTTLASSENSIFPLDKASVAYQKVLSGSSERVILHISH